MTLKIGKKKSDLSKDEVTEITTIFALGLVFVASNFLIWHGIIEW
ncbi:hypothetical protein Hs30E_02310 [Lactococcus hodotermopsidis]|uniref:Uncharacterized protein n=1 Tax=Pseudolactococcus hodotermopsidis TaxID=2709157 RepID=A0A6A0B8G3_9LACT|nr:hypothetical protein [Lactococcus hodotermopsidis]GFH41680.1 hypothetical protein Hs30E_02310 [Lactococcus hodotermopsidis]